MACPPRLGLPKGVGLGVPGSAGTHTTPQAPVASCETTGLLHPEPRGQLRLERSVCMKHEGCARLPQTPRAGSGASGAPRGLACLLKDGLQSVLGG